MATTPRFNMPYLVEGQQNGETTHNEALIRIDALGSISVIDRDLDTPPGGESDGDTYLVKTPGQGAWAGHGGELATSFNSSYLFTTVVEGMSLWINDEDVRLDYDGAAYHVTSATEVQIYYVGKHGIDTATGKSHAGAVLTFGQAITLASAATPAVDNLFAIACTDAGIYAESLTVPSYVHVYAPNAEINGNHVIADDASLRWHQTTLGSGVVVTKSAGAGEADAHIEHLVLTGTAEGFKCTSGRLIAHFERGSTVNGSIVGEDSNSLINVFGEVILITGTGTGIKADTAGGEITGFVGAIYETGAGTGILIANGALANIQVPDLKCDTVAYNCEVGGVLNLSVDAIAGTQTEAGTVALVVPNPTTHLSPAVIVGQEDDYNPTGLASARYLRLTAAAGRDITGITAPTINVSRRELIIYNIGAGAITLKNENVASAAANRFDLIADIVIPSDGGVHLVYDDTAARWRCVGKYIA